MLKTSPSPEAGIKKGIFSIKASNFNSLSLKNMHIVTHLPGTCRPKYRDVLRFFTFALSKINKSTLQNFTTGKCFSQLS